MDNTKLIAALEGATGPDRELDARIRIALGLSKANVAAGMDGWCINSETNPNPYKSPAYTADVNAALKLVPPDCWLEIKGPRKYLNIPSPVPNVWSAYIAKWNEEGNVMGWGATPALAICIAALKSRP